MNETKRDCKQYPAALYQQVVRCFSVLTNSNKSRAFIIDYITCRGETKQSYRIRLFLLVLFTILLFVFDKRPTTKLAAGVFLLIPFEIYQDFWNRFTWRKLIEVFVISNGILLAFFLWEGAPIWKFYSQWIKVSGLIALVYISWHLGHSIFISKRQDVALAGLVLILFVLLSLSMYIKIYFSTSDIAMWLPNPWQRNRAAVLLSMASGAIYVNATCSLLSRFKLDYRLLGMATFAIGAWTLWQATASETAKLILVLAAIYPVIYYIIRKFFRFIPALVFVGGTMVLLFSIDVVYRVYIDNFGGVLGGVVGARLEIWRFVTQLILDNHVAPLGFNALDWVDDWGSLPNSAERIYIVSDRISHPHNAGLQILLELGLVGLLIAGWFMFIAGRIIESLAPDAHFITIAAICVALVSHGAWQSWWWLALVLFVLYFGARYTSHDAQSKLSGEETLAGMAQGQQKPILFRE